MCTFDLDLQTHPGWKLDPLSHLRSGSWFLVWSQWQATIGIGAAWNQRFFVQDDCHQLGFLLPLGDGNFSKQAEISAYEKTNLSGHLWMRWMKIISSGSFNQYYTPPSSHYYYLLYSSTVYRVPNVQSRPSNATAAGLRCSSQYVWAAGFARCCWTLWLDAKWLSRHHTFDPQRLPGTATRRSCPITRRFVKWLLCPFRAKQDESD